MNRNKLGSCGFCAVAILIFILIVMGNAGCQTVSGLGRDMTAVSDWTGSKIRNGFNPEPEAPEGD